MGRLQGALDALDGEGLLLETHFPFHEELRKPYREPEVEVQGVVLHTQVRELQHVSGLLTGQPDIKGNWPPHGIRCGEGVEGSHGHC